MTRITAVSDLHGRLEGLGDELDGCGVCVVAGDFSRQTGFGRSDLLEQIEWIRSEFFGFIKSFPDTDFVVVAGNHDLCLDPEKTKAAGIRDAGLEWPSNAFYLRDSGATVRGIRFYGTPWVPIINRRWAFEAESGSLCCRFFAIPEGVDILVTHAPPRLPGWLGDVSLQWGVDGERFGSAELAGAVFEKKPRRLFCGHIHSGSHEPFVFGETTVQNVSICDEMYEKRYEPARLAW